MVKDHGSLTPVLNTEAYPAIHSKFQLNFCSSVVLRIVLDQPGKLRSFKRIDQPFANEIIRLGCFRMIDAEVLRGEYHYKMDAKRSLSSNDLARLLGISIPTIHRDVAKGVVAPLRGGGKRGLRFGPATIDLLAARHGLVPQSLLAHISRTEAFVAAALALRPLGLRSKRAIAEAAGVSPTAAGKALMSLQERGLVEAETRRVVEGKVKEVKVYVINRDGSLWFALAPGIRQVRPPLKQPAPKMLPGRVPGCFSHLFSDVNAAALRTGPHRDFVVRRILASNDLEAIAWLASSFPAESIAAAIRSPRALEPRLRALAEALAKAG